MKITISSKTLSSYSEIDKFALIPKKQWADFELGEHELIINGKNEKVEIIEMLCDCVGPDKIHQHRIIDLRNVWDDLSLESKKEIEIG